MGNILKHKPISKSQNDRQWTRNNRSAKLLKKQIHKRERLRSKMNLKIVS